MPNWFHFLFRIKPNCYTIAVGWAKRKSFQITIAIANHFFFHFDIYIVILDRQMQKEKDVHFQHWMRIASKNEHIQVHVFGWKFLFALLCFHSFRLIWLRWLRLTTTFFRIRMKCTLFSCCYYILSMFRLPHSFMAFLFLSLSLLFEKKNFFHMCQCSFFIFELCNLRIPICHIPIYHSLYR